jgi:hypothetical protein
MKNAASQKDSSDTVLFLILGVLGALFLPIVFLSLFFTYFTWASYRHNEERKFIRTVFIFLIGLCVSFGVSDYWFNVLPKLIKSFGFSNQKLVDFVSLPAFKYAFLSYIPMSVIIFFIHNVRPKSLKFYEHIRLNIGSILRVAHLFQTISVLIVGSFFEKFLGIKPQKPNLSFWIIYSITGLFVMLVSVAMVEFFWVFVKLPGNFILANKTIVCSYFLIYFYDYISHSFQKSPEAFNAISHIKNETGIYVGRLIDPKKMDLILSWRDVNHHI